MHITSIDVCQPISAESPPDWRTSLGQILVSMETDSGHTGYGVGGGGIAGMHIIQSIFREQLIGSDFEPVEHHWEQLSASLLPVGSDGLAMMALSAVDLALWDLRGKYSGLPIAKLLNSELDLDTPIPTYQTVWGNNHEALSDSPCGVKLHLGHHADGTRSRESQVDQFVQQTRQARETIGPHRPLMVDAWMTWDVEMTLEYDRQTADLNLDWIEEPLPLTDLQGYRKLSNRCRAPIAGGEHLFSLHDFEEVLRKGLHRIVQPDICWMGGLTPLIKLIQTARKWDVRVIPHRGGEVWGLHAVAGLLDEPLAESPRPWMTWVGGQPEIQNGHIKLSNEPGFGVSIDPSFPDVQRVLRID